MPNIARSLLSAAFLALLLAGCAAPANDIRAAFGAFKAAVGGRDGKAAAQLAASSDIAYYEARRLDALSLPAAKLRELPLGKKIEVLRLRASFAAERLKDMDGQALLAAAIEKGWYGDESMSLLALGDDVVVAGDRATAGVVVEGRKTGTSYSFVREGGTWKVVVVDSARASDDILAMVAKENLMTEDQYAEYMLAASGISVAPGLWEPLRKPGD